jgi:hypothetical protein
MIIDTGQRTFFYAVSGTIPLNLYVPFLDTAGNPIKCNYVNIAATNATVGGNGYLAVELSGLSRVTSINSIQPATFHTNPQASGICGFGFPYGGGRIVNSQEWHGSNGEVAVGATLRNNGHSAAGPQIIIGITYGNLLPFNPLKVSGFSNLGQYGTEYDKGR